MLFKKTENEGKITGYTLSLSEWDTYTWAHRPVSCWPCSTLSDHEVEVHVDSNGLCDLYLDGSQDNLDEIDGNELEAIVSDHLPEFAQHLWPTWR